MRLLSGLKRAIRKLGPSSPLADGDDPRSYVLKQIPTDAVCAEIGVWKGDYSEKIVQQAKPRKLHLIDPWEFQPEFPERMYGGSVAKGQQDMDSIFESVKEKFSNRPEVAFNRGRSEEVLKEFPDAYFDWVYIDGNHYYEYVLSDLEICYSKVKPGGVIAGDDFTWGKKYGFPVRRAVSDFVSSKRIKKKLEVIHSQFLIRL